MYAAYIHNLCAHKFFKYKIKYRNKWDTTKWFHYLLLNLKLSISEAKVHHVTVVLHTLQSLTRSSPITSQKTHPCVSLSIG